MLHSVAIHFPKAGDLNKAGKIAHSNSANTKAVELVGRRGRGGGHGFGRRGGGGFKGFKRGGGGVNAFVCVVAGVSMVFSATEAIR